MAVKKIAPTPAVASAAPSTVKEVKSKETKPKVAKAAEPKVAAIASVTKTEVAAPSQSSEVLLATLTEQLKALSSEFSTKVRDVVKSVQEASKAAKKEQRDSKKKRKINPADMTPEQRTAWEARRANNAFLVEKPLTPELCAFMGLPSGSKRSQTQVTKFISDYVKSHSCFDPTFKRRILPNTVLAKLLRVDDKTEVTYLNLQKFLKVHFIKPTTA
jgi:chromatin remodeling complex protein RSC6